MTIKTPAPSNLPEQVHFLGWHLDGPTTVMARLIARLIAYDVIPRERFYNPGQGENCLASIALAEDADQRDVDAKAKDAVIAMEECIRSYAGSIPWTALSS